MTEAEWYALCSAEWRLSRAMETLREIKAEERRRKEEKSLWRKVLSILRGGKT